MFILQPYFATACLATVFFFPKMVAIAALLMLCIGDSLVGLLGVILFLFWRSGHADVKAEIWRGRNNARHQGSVAAAKDAELMLSMLLICFLVGALFVPPYVAFVGAIGAMLADAVPWQIGGRVLDGNLTVSLSAGVSMAVVSLF